MNEDLCSRATLPKSCKHISFIHSKFISNVLQLTHPDVMNVDENQCYIPGCQNTEKSLLKTFIHMGHPPKRTYHSINYIGLGLFNGIDTSDWYTAYVPLNVWNFNDDIYHIKRSLIRIISHSKLWLDNHDSTNEDAEDICSSTQFVTQGDLAENIFKNPAKTANLPDNDKYIFATPSCMYASKSELASHIEFDGLDVKLQILVQVKVRPRSFIESSNTLQLNPSFDSCFPNDCIEWYVSNTDNIVPERLLFKILPKTSQPNDKQNVHTSEVSKVDKKVTLIAPLTNITKKLSSEPGFLELQNSYMYELTVDSLVFDTPFDKSSDLDDLNKYLLLKFKWTENHNKTIYYLKTLINNKNLEWNASLKVWKIPCLFLYEIVKFTLYLGLKVNEKVLYTLWNWIRDLNIKNVSSTFSVHTFTAWVKNYNVWSFQRIILTISNSGTVENVAGSSSTDPYLSINIIPYNKDLISLFKERNSVKPHYLWDQTNQYWRCNRLRDLIIDALTLFPNLREQNVNEQEILEEKGIFLSALKPDRFVGKRPVSNLQVKDNKRYKCDVEMNDEFETISKILITAAGENRHIPRLTDKINRITQTISPPESSISSNGKIIMGGAGTGGIEFVEVPRDVETWNQISFCVVPNEDEDGNIPVDQYDHNLLASLIGEVFIIKESAIDYLISNFKQWPSPHDTINYTKWTNVVTKNEPKCWGGLDFDGRQSLAQTRLFSEEDFYISGSNMNRDAMLCRLLIQLGNGKIVEDAKDAEYVIVTDNTTDEALELYRQVCVLLISGLGSLEIMMKTK
ncbi:hypothetical protein BEWA_017590 [Theileria equi strain WA]|uniref:Uncharacterized protein n=1 Tax=Theileria equi strain WA TaxID=1537102 RepID=L0AUL7_THEEQ|nr:hypothetical protein BEWA_017590 [Theileria equi strain WA]AFZ78918.1 hypothetical protein BEWA_017590 [Theileria equi strain WA]|eukprot:XP_004828584.1 hypothetical protein BEWA_017590 [Theileria equi strain WA]